MEITNNKTCKVDNQIATELYYSKKAVDVRIQGIINRDEEIQECMSNVVSHVNQWIEDFSKYDSKIQRLATFKEENDIEEFVNKALISVMKLVDRRDLLAAMSGQLAGMIDGLDELDSVTTAGEILTAMCDCDLIDLTKAENTYTKDGETKHTLSWYVSNPWELDKVTIDHIERAIYLPPMIIQPQKISENNHCGYLTRGKESVILGKGNHHNLEQNLSNLNRFNSVALSLNVDMLKFVTEDMLNDEEKRKAINSNPKRKEQYDNLMKQSFHVYAYLVNNDNKFWLTHKYDKRGRTYASGFHCSTQGNSFRKAMIELNKKEIVTGDFE